MKKVAFAEDIEPSRQETRAKPSGTFQKKGLLEGQVHSNEYSSAIDSITSMLGCTDIRSLFRLMPALFDSVVKIELEIHKEHEPMRIGAVVDSERVYFTAQSNLDDPLEKTLVPLILTDSAEPRRIGDMHLLSFRPLRLNPLNPNDEAETGKVLDIFGSLVARTIDAKLDGLTALPQRKYFDRSLEEHAAAFRSEGRNFSLITIDIDHFKRINDDDGHMEGDRVLSSVARILHNGVRGRTDCMDMVFRTGGEEFAILLPDVGMVEASKIAERLRLMVKAHEFNVSHRVTCSFGVAEASEALDAASVGEEVCRLADDRLYMAKGNGRDSVFPRIDC